MFKRHKKVSKEDKIDSFRLIKRKYYVRPIFKDGYFGFASSTLKFIFSNKRLFFGLVFVISFFTAVLIGIGSEDTYSSLVDTLKTSQSNSVSSVLGQVGNAGLLFVSSISGGLNGELSSEQQIIVIFISLMGWLATIWMVRSILAGKKIKVRDALYNSGAPIIPTIIIFLVIFIQLIPAALALIGYASAVSAGVISDGGAIAMLFWLVASLLALLSIYLISGSLFALIIVTLPGVYPLKALSMAYEFVIGRRVKIILRIFWMFIFTAIFWAIIYIPIILIDMWLKSMISAISWVPVVPILVLISSSVSIVWMSTYIYMLYRKIVEYDGQK